MKLEFESNAVSSPLVNNDVPAEFDTERCSPEVLQMLREGIKAAQDGDQAEARNILLRVTEADPKNENAWLWLASISEYPEELLVFLNNVLAVNPENERALEWAKATKSLIAKTFVQRGIDASKDDQKKFAKQCFLQAIVHDSESELAWLWLASVTDSNDEKTTHLQKVLSINPENENALSSLKNAKRHSAKTKLPTANAAAISGDRELAHEILDEIFIDAADIEDAWMLKAHISESFDDKIMAFEKVLEINPENPVARANVDSLRLFAAENSEDEGVPMPEEGFDDSEPEDISFDAGSGPDKVTEAYNSLDSTDSDAEYYEEESVGFEEIATADEGAEEAAPEAMELFEDDVEELIQFKELMNDSSEESAADEPEASFESNESEEEQESGTSTAAFEEAANETDHVESDHNDDADSVQDSANDPAIAEFSEETAHLTLDEISESADEVQSEDTDPEALAADFDADSADDAEEQEAMFESDDKETSEEANFDSMDTDSGVEESEDAEEVELSGDSEDKETDAVFESQDEDSDVQEMESLESNTDENDQQVMDSESETTDADTQQQLSPEPKFESNLKIKTCPYCEESNENQAFACHSCKAIFTISDIEMILSHKNANNEVISKALKKMESSKTLRGVDVEELKHMGIGYINLKDFRKGFDYLQEAAKKDPNDVVLLSQIDALAIRLAEIEEHERVQEPVTKGKRILVVDDSPTVRKLISGKLEKCGHEAICAVDGMDALAKVNEVIPDLILLDITMPRMDGYQVCKLIRGNDATKDVPIVMISGKDGFFDKVRGRMAGTSNYITKPFGPETLMKTINEYVK